MISANLKAAVKQQEIKEMAAVPYNFLFYRLKKHPQNSKYNGKGLSTNKFCHSWQILSFKYLPHPLFLMDNTKENICLFTLCFNAIFNGGKGGWGVGGWGVT